MRTATAVLGALAVLVAAGWAGARLFATRSTLCVDGVDGSGNPAGFCEDTVHLSVAGGVLTVVAVVALVVVALVRRGR